jgi:hypothetical protein
MGLVRRGAKSIYLYRTFREGGKVRCCYVGSGLAAVRAARAAAQRRRRRREAQARRRETAREERLLAAARRDEFLTIKAVLDERDRRLWRRFRRRHAGKDRDAKAQIRADLAKFRRELRRQDEQMTGFCGFVDLALELAGYRQHKRGEWRVRRMGTEILPAGGPRGDVRPLTAADRKRATDFIWEWTKRLGRLETEAEAAILQELLDRDPKAAFFMFGADVAESVQGGLILDAFPGEVRQGHREAARLRLRQFKAELAGPEPVSPLVRLAIDRVTTCWLDLHVVELRYHDAVEDFARRPAAPGWPNTGKAMIESLERRLDHAHRRYLSALKALAFIQHRPPAGPVRLRAAAKAGDGGTAEAAVEIERDSSLLSG